jgi:iron complex outermembrane receptor protein
MMSRRITGALVGAMLTIAHPLCAQDLQDYRQSVVVTAAAIPIELGSVTRTVDVMTREQIAALPVQSVADVLRLMSSIDVRARGERGVQTDFAVRGASFGQVLVLVDGVRLNDAQSGHHDGDIPVPLDAVERIEVLYGSGSSLFGADAFGGTINIITRRGAVKPSLVVQGGSFGYAAARGDVGMQRGAVAETVDASVDRSGGFMDDRDFATTILRSRTGFGARSSLTVAFLRKEFGANNFYGGNAPSREWTNQTLIAADRGFGEVGGWDVGADASYRTHGDRFVFNQLNPALSDNRHRTHEVLGSVKASRRVGSGGSVTIGGEGGGNWIRSSNLGDHDLARISGFGEWRQALGTAQIDASLRADRYSEFGTSWNPAVGVGWWASRAVRLRASTGRAFRVPTFTERYYSDPANLARPEVGPERSWSTDAGADLFLSGGWLLQATVFGRADHDVIDWLRATPAERWRTYNVRDVTTHGLELAARKGIGRSSFVQAGYTYVDLNAAAVTQLSKYLLDYAPHSFVAAGSLTAPGELRLAPRLEYRRRTRSSGTSDDVVLDLRVARRISSLFDVMVDGTNLFDQRYQEIAGVDMPGAALTVSLAVRTR